MSDIIERLRSLATETSTFGSDADVFSEAADEIARLTDLIPDANTAPPSPQERAAVFTCDEVVNLSKYQTARQYHPFTCDNRGDGNHGVAYGDLGALIPTVRGWICPFCDYTQDWAHGFMKGAQKP